MAVLIKKVNVRACGGWVATGQKMDRIESTEREASLDGRREEGGGRRRCLAGRLSPDHSSNIYMTC